MFEAVKWFARSIGPYLVGILVGIGFAYLLMIFVSGMKSPQVEGWITNAKEILADTPMVEATKTPPPIAAAPHVGKVHKPSVPKDKAPPLPPPVEKTEPPGQVVAKSVMPAEAKVAETVAETVTAKVTAKVAEKVVESKPTPVPDKTPTKEASAAIPPDYVMSCGAPPSYPGPEMNKYLACRWKENCLNRLAQARYMIDQGRMRCPTIGYNAQPCQNYYQSLEDRYQPSMCEQ